MSNSSVNMPLVKAVRSGRVFLRRATSRLHQRIDQGSVLTERDYEGIDWPLVQARALCPPRLPPYIPRVPSLTRDLNAIGVIPRDLRSAPRHSPLARHYGLRMPNTEAAYLGVRYVVEGAQLGNLAIYGHLHEAFGRRVSEFGTFWTPGSILPCSWPNLLKILGRMESRDSLAAAARAAPMTFHHMAANLAVLEMKSP